MQLELLAGIAELRWDAGLKWDGNDTTYPKKTFPFPPLKTPANHRYCRDCPIALS